jgi:NADH-quinone oxidoreductase subunit H
VPLSTAAQLLGITGLPLVVGVLSIVIFLAKVVAMIFFFMWVRWTVPRFRYDQIMKLGWQKLLPLSIANLLFYAIAIAVIQK